MASHLFHFYDLRNMSAPAQQLVSSLKYMTRSLACMPDGHATASIEGRIAVEYFDPSPAAQEKKYAFKCHRQTIDDVYHVWPVNVLAFHLVYNTFAGAGSDGTVSIWDHKVKKRLRQYPKRVVHYVQFGWNQAGNGSTWDEGETGLKTANQPMIVVRKLGEEVKPKGWPGNYTVVPGGAPVGQLNILQPHFNAYAKYRYQLDVDNDHLTVLKVWREYISG